MPTPASKKTDYANKAKSSAESLRGNTVQAKASSTDTAWPNQSNRTGLPHNLKIGIENLSGYAMNDVKVHYNSSQPAQLQAHAYAQGTDIHIAPGQEKHLPHEAWHVVQQKQGRVKHTRLLKGKLNVNDSAGLEEEADQMGAKAVQMRTAPVDTQSRQTSSLPYTAMIQRKVVGNYYFKGVSGDVLNLEYLISYFNPTDERQSEFLEHHANSEEIITLQTLQQQYPDPLGEMEDENIQEAVIEHEAIPGFESYSTGRVFNKGKAQGEFGTVKTRMIMEEIAGQFHGYDTHVSVFPHNIDEDAWNQRFWDEGMYCKESEAIDAANQKGDIADYSTMNYSEFHVTFGHGSQSFAHFFYDLSENLIRENNKGGIDESEINELREQANAIAKWFCS